MEDLTGGEEIKMNMDSILETAKKNLPSDYTPFDAEIIEYTNTVLGTLNELGVGVYGYQISDEDEGSWSDFLANEISLGLSIPEVKTYLSKKVTLYFDPPTSGILMNAMNENIKELEWRIVDKREIGDVR